ncbi:MAG: (d)CMP kinase [Lachnospiraceae bacterium]|nr:(d)CMP kinase [Lachnospiraceae bacterium]
MKYSIAIDGPAGAGKSTIAKELAKKLGYIYVDTGAMYRAMALYFLRLGLCADQHAAIAESCKNVRVAIEYLEGVQQIILNGENVTAFLREEEVGRMASATSIYPEVRMKLVELQRALAAEEDVIMDGRDIGTYVLPNANVKIYLTASVETRANRRYLELKEKGIESNYEEIKKDIEERDYRDKNREFAPLLQAEDAVLLDTSDMTVEEVINSILTIKEKAK